MRRSWKLSAVLLFPMLLVAGLLYSISRAPPYHFLDGLTPTLVEVNGALRGTRFNFEGEYAEIEKRAEKELRALGGHQLRNFDDYDWWTLDRGKVFICMGKGNLQDPTGTLTESHGSLTSPKLITVYVFQPAESLWEKLEKSLIPD